MEQSICIFYANVPIFAPLHLSPLIIANPIRYLPGYILSKMPSYTLYTQQTAIEREQNYSLLRIPTSPSYLLFGRIPLIIKQWNTMILIDIIVICNCLSIREGGWNTGTRNTDAPQSVGWGWRGDGRWKLWRSCFQKLTIILEGMVWMLCD